MTQFLKKVELKIENFSIFYDFRYFDNIERLLNLKKIDKK